MDEQHRYEINLKKEDLYIQLSSDDVYFISKQMDKWFRILLDDSYVPVSYPSPQPVMPPPPPPVAPPAPPVVEEPPPPPPAPEPEPEPEPVVQAPPPAPVPDVVSQVELPLAEPAPVPAAPAASASLDQAVEDDFEAVMDSLMKDLGDEEPEDEPEPARPAPVAAGNGKSATPPAPPDTIDSLSELCDRSHASNLEDYLLLSAYYLTYFEGQEKFSLKRINSMLVKSGLTPVNHSVLETMLAQGYLSMVPDLTGTADVSEYILTEDGQSQANSLL